MLTHILTLSQKVPNRILKVDYQNYNNSLYVVAAVYARILDIESISTLQTELSSKEKHHVRENKE